MSIKRSSFGHTQKGEAVERLTMTNSEGAKVSILTYGGIIQRISVPDKHGIFADVCLGYDSVSDYERGEGYLGALIGRYGNRIAGGHLEIDGRTCQLNRNEGSNHLHGGFIGYDKHVWTVSEVLEGDGEDSIKLFLESPDGEEHYPGKLTIDVTYTWDDDNELTIHYHAVPDAKTVINLTNHAYFNLRGHNAGSILDHQLCIRAERFTVVDKESIPTGELREVAGTPFDLRSLSRIGDGMAQVAQNEQLSFTGGYDHNFVIDDAGQGIRKACELYEAKSGRVMEVFTDTPGVQFYAGNALEIPFPAKDHAQYGKNGGLCLETQYFPDSPNHPEFPSCLFDAGEPFTHTTVYKFSVPENE